MATTVDLRSTLVLKGSETLDSVLAKHQTIQYSMYNTTDEQKTLDKDVTDLSKTLSGATGTLDLTAAPLARQPAVTTNLTGAKLFAIQISAPVTNVGAITVKQGATNGFPILGSASLAVLNPGDRIILLSSSITPKQAVDATHKTIDYSGTSGDTVKIVAYFTSV